MKKLLLMIVGAFMLSTSLWAADVIPFTVHYEDDQPAGSGHGRGPIKAPLVYINDYTLAFEAYHPDYVLTLKDENGDVVYTTTVYSTETLVTLPSTLSGDYEIQLVMGNWLFTGWINL